MSDIDLQRQIDELKARLDYLSALQNIGASGTYTPTLTNVTNVAASTAYLCGYTRIGNMGWVAGVISIDPTAGGLAQVRCSLPITSALTDALQAGGTFASTDLFMAGAIEADPTNDAVLFTFYPTDTANRNYRFTFGFQII